MEIALNIVLALIAFVVWRGIIVGTLTILWATIDSWGGYRNRDNTTNWSKIGYTTVLVCICLSAVTAVVYFPVWVWGALS